MNSVVTRFALVTALSAATHLTTSLLAQEGFPPIAVTSRYQVKFEKSGDMTAAMKEYNQVLRKAGSERYYAVWRSQTGEASLLVMSFHKNWADLDYSGNNDPKMKPYMAEINSIGSRLNTCVTTGTRVMQEVRTDASLPPAPTIPKMVFVFTGYAQSGKLDEVLALIKSDLLPAVKAAGRKTFLVMTTRFGGSTREFQIASDMDGWSMYDAPIAVRKAMGDDRYEAYLKKMRALLTDGRYDVYRYDENVSYQPAK